MDNENELISTLLARNNLRMSKPQAVIEAVRALGYGLGGNIDKYQPLQAKQDNEIQKLIATELIKRQFKDPTRYQPTTREEYLADQKELGKIRSDNSGNQGKKLKDTIVDVMAGLTPPEELPVNAIQPQDIPMSLGSAEGGEVLYNPEPIKGNDGITRQAEYAQGYEPKPFLPALPAVLPEKLRNRYGITEQEAQRKALGFGKPIVSKTITPTTAIGIISDPFKSQQLKKENPELYNELMNMVNSTIGKGRKTVASSMPIAEENNAMETNW